MEDFERQLGVDIEPKRMAESFELKNKDGLVIATVEIEIEEVHDPKERSPLRVVQSCYLQSADGIKVNLFEFLEIDNKEKPVYQIEDIRFASYDSKKGKTKILPLNTPVNVAIALHEFGHLKQFEEERFRKVAHMSREMNAYKQLPSINYWPEIRNQLSLIEQETGIALEQHVGVAILEELDRLYKNYNDFLNEPENNVDDEAVNTECIRLEREFMEAMKKYEISIRSFLSQPRILLEGDATNRAIQWMERLAKQHGIDLIKDTESIQDLEKALRSYSF